MMKNKKIRLFMCIAAAAMLPALPCAAEGEQGNMLDIDISGMVVCNGSQISYRLEDDQTVSIIGCGSDMTGKVKIPDTIEEKPVTTIAESAFYGVKGLTGVMIPDSVINIENGAFYECTALSDVILPENLRVIGESAFYGCTALTTIDIPDSVMGISESCFSGCTALENVEFPDSLISIGKSAFYNTKCPKNLKFPADLNTIEEMAFAYCTNVETVEFSSNIITLGNYVFDGCSALNSIEVDDANASFCDENGVLFDKGMTTLLKYPAAKADKEYTVPIGVTTLANWSFVGAHNLEQIDLSTVRTFGEETFYQCDSLKSVAIPEDIAELPSAVFAYCESLTNIEIPAHCAKIGEYAFMNCTGLKSIDVPATVTEIGDFAIGFAYDEESEAMKQMKGFRIHTTAGSAAATYAKRSKVKYSTDSKVGLIFLILLGICAIAGVVAYFVYRKKSEMHIGAGPNQGQVIRKKKASAKGDTNNEEK